MPLRTGPHPFTCRCGRCTATPGETRRSLPQLRPFSKDQIANILGGKITAYLALPDDELQTGTAPILRRRVMGHDADNVETGWRTHQVTQGEGEDKAPVRITIMSTDLVQVVSASPQPFGIPLNTAAPQLLTDSQAKACGHRNLIGCRADWQEHHPGEHFAVLTRFLLGDARDDQQFMARSAGETTVAALSIDPTAPKVPKAEQARQTVDARKADAERIADPDIRLRLELQRALDEWEDETGGTASTADSFKTIKTIREQVRKLDRRLGTVGTPVLPGHVDHPDYVSRLDRDKAA